MNIYIGFISWHSLLNTLMDGRYTVFSNTKKNMKQFINKYPSPIKKINNLS